MKKYFLLAVTILGLFSLLAACTAAADDPLIQPTDDKLTFVFFYTDG